MLKVEPTLERRVTAGPLGIGQLLRPKLSLRPKPAGRISTPTPQVGVMQGVRDYLRVERLPDRIEQFTHAAFESQGGVAEPIGPLLGESLDCWLPPGDQVCNEPHQLSHGRVATAPGHVLQQLRQTCLYTGLTQRRSVGDHWVRLVQPAVEPFMGQPLDYLAHDGTRQDVSQIES